MPKNSSPLERDSPHGHITHWIGWSVVSRGIWSLKMRIYQTARIEGGLADPQVILISSQTNSWSDAFRQWDDSQVHSRKGQKCSLPYMKTPQMGSPMVSISENHLPTNTVEWSTMRC